MTTSAGRMGVPTAVRSIRRLVPPDSPWPGALVRADDGASRLLVDVALLEDWDGWDAAPDGHVLGPVDVLRRADGHDVLLPLCTERVMTLVTRRGDGLPFSPGEAITLAVSILRGSVEIARRGAGGATGSWWLTDEGRPVFVDDREGPGADAAGADLLEYLAQDSSGELAAILLDAAAAVRDPRTLAHEVGDIEARLFEVAAAEPLATAPLASTRLRHATVDREATDQHDDEDRRPLGAALLAAVDSDLADAFSRATTGLWRRLRQPPRRSRRRAWALAGCLAGGVIVVGLLWPAPDGPAMAGADSPPASALATSLPAPAAPTTSEPHADAVAPDLVSVTDALLDRRRECRAAGDDACLADVVEDPGRTLPPGAADLVSDERALTLLDEFGGVAVLRAESTTGDAAAQLVVITDDDGTWLLRDIHTIAEEQ